ncbi:hypothetical protein LBMAG42_35220 [Deltaproteobacteria bacterium]|nr:hypothetical protein LBMAG42_35220 [Deltaproteobacteria bacterium]
MTRFVYGLPFLLTLACLPEGTTGKTEDTSSTNGLDDSGDSSTDDDGDGYSEDDGDCDDVDATVSPLGIEICNGVDDNCDGAVDEGVSTTYYVDADLDGFGDDATGLNYCEPPEGQVVVAGDCDDQNDAFYPSANEPCTENIDYNCDGETAWADDDADGWALCEDCDDLDPSISPEGTEVCNGLDDDCDGVADPTSSFDVVPFYADSDADGYGDLNNTTSACAAPPGYTTDTTDCDDARADVNPGAMEVCDSLDTDEDCDGSADDNDGTVDGSTFTTFYSDGDADTYGDDTTAVSQCNNPGGWVEVGADCRDTDANFYPGAPEADCADPNDYNCDGSVAYTDADSDGWAACIECDDNEATVYPGAAERCNGVDDDCDGVVDPDTSTDSLTWYADADGDSFGDPAVSTASCSNPAGYVADATDCDDTAPAVYPGATESCNYIDDDCDGVIDPTTSVDALTWYADADADTFGDATATTPACELPAGFVADDTDCDDTSASVYPGATEYCNGIDDDCDTVIDPDSAFDALNWYADADADAYGDAAVISLACSQPAGYVADDTDCDDTRADVNPGANEVCDALDTDEDCDGAADDDDSSTDVTTMTSSYDDGDGDGYGDPASVVTQCEAPAGYIADGTDCDDSRSGVHPGASENCDAADVDEDCDGLSDDDDPGVVAATMDTWYADVDGDTYGSTVTLDACDIPAGYVGADGDCDDADATINPDASEVCDSVDNDCDGAIDIVSGSDICWSGAREFDNCSMTTYLGPSQAQCDSSYLSTTLDGEVTVSAGIQEWEVPTTGSYIIEAWGAQGFAGDPSRSGGLGAYATGTFSLTAGDVLYIVVGQKGTGGVNSGGGGGGSFVVNSAGSPLVVAGGGGGTRLSVYQNGCDGRSSTYGGYGSSSSPTSLCGVKTTSLGLGGVVSGTSWGSGGAGFSGNGASESTYSASWGGQGGKSWSNGMLGGVGNAGCGRADGGFGGGGSGNGCYGGGGGGGYSGGDGGRLAGGGGSYIDSSGTATSSTAAVKSGHGAVTIDM